MVFKCCPCGSHRYTWQRDCTLALLLPLCHCQQLFEMFPKYRINAVLDAIFAPVSVHTNDVITVSFSGPSSRHKATPKSEQQEGLASWVSRLQIQADDKSCFHTSAELASVDISLLECCEDIALRNNRSYQIIEPTWRHRRLRLCGSHL